MDELICKIYAHECFESVWWQYEWDNTTKTISISSIVFDKDDCTSKRLTMTIDYSMCCSDQHISLNIALWMSDIQYLFSLVDDFMAYVNTLLNK
jgi:hypothetical protein